MKILTFRANSRRRESGGHEGASHEEPARRYQPLEGQKTYLSGRSMHRCFYYNKGVTAKWNSADRVVFGMRWNYYLASGRITPIFSPLEPLRAGMMDGRLKPMARDGENEFGFPLQCTKQPGPARAGEHAGMSRPAREDEGTSSECPVIPIRRHRSFRPLRIVKVPETRAIAPVSPIKHSGLKPREVEPRREETATQAPIMPGQMLITMVLADLARMPFASVAPSNDTETANPPTRPADSRKIGHRNEITLIPAVRSGKSAMLIIPEIAGSLIAEVISLTRGKSNQGAVRPEIGAPHIMHQAPADPPISRNFRTAKGPGYIGSARRKTVHLKVARADALPPL